MRCEENDVEYLFSDTIAPNLRDEFINYHQILISYLETHQIFLDDQIKNYIMEDYPSRTDKTFSKIFYDIEDSGTYMQILITLQFYFGDFTNYGMLFGLSNYIAEELGWETDVPIYSNNELVEFTELLGNQDYLDLTYPCFLPSYVTDKLPIIKAIASQLLRDLINQNGMAYVFEVLNRENESPTLFLTEITQIKNQWLSSIGSTARLTEREIAIRFQYGGLTSPMIVSAVHAKYYLLNDYSEANMDMMKIDYFKSDYSHLIEALTQIELDMRMSDQIYKDPERTYSPFSVVLCSEEITMNVANSIAYYSTSSHTAFSSSVWPINHEYLHYLTTPDVGYNWQYEAIVDFEDRSSYFMRKFYESFFEDMIFYDWDCLTIMQEYLGRDPQIDDFPTYCDIIITLNDENDVNALNPYVLISVPNYVLITYGQEVLQQIFLHQDTIEQEISLSWQELIDEWNLWLIDTYGYLR